MGSSPIDLNFHPLSMKALWSVAVLTLSLSPLVSFSADFAVPVHDPAGSVSTSSSVLELDNGVIVVRLDLDAGGAIGYLSLSGKDRSLINVHDRGRYVQQSYYAGQALDRRSEGQHPAWSPWPWNPIGVGDAYGNSAEVVSYNVDGGTAYVKTRPLLWDMRNETAECFLETWVNLNGKSVHIRNKLTSFRTDDLWNSVPRHQESPAAYLIGDLSTLYTYVGNAPWENGDLTVISNNGPPWRYWNTPEHWAAFVNDDLFGVGVYNRACTLFVGGFHGSIGGGPSKNSTGYISPLRREILGKTSVYEYECDLIVGDLEEIRRFVYNSNRNRVAHWYLYD